MYPLIIGVFLVFSYDLLRSQTIVDTIQIQPNGFNAKYIYQDQPLINLELSRLVENLPEASAEFKSFQTYKVLGLITSLSALALIPWALNSSTQEDTRMALGYTFIGLELATIPFSIEKMIHKKKSVRSYNRNVLNRDQ